MVPGRVWRHKSAAMLMKWWSTINDRLRSEIDATKVMHVASPIFLRHFPLNACRYEDGW